MCSSDLSARLGSEESEDLAQRTETVRAERETFATTVAGLRERTAEVERALDEQRRERDAVTHLLESRSGDLSSLRLDEQRLTLERDEITRRAEEELGLTSDALLEGFEPEEELREKAALSSLEREVRDLKGQLDRMGPVNMEALAELEEVLDEFPAARQRIEQTATERLRGIQAAAASESARRGGMACRSIRRKGATRR